MTPIHRPTLYYGHIRLQRIIKNEYESKNTHETLTCCSNSMNNVPFYKNLQNTLVGSIDVYFTNKDLTSFKSGEECTVK